MTSGCLTAIPSRHGRLRSAKGCRIRMKTDRRKATPAPNHIVRAGRHWTKPGPNDARAPSRATERAVSAGWRAAAAPGGSVVVKALQVRRARVGNGTAGPPGRHVRHQAVPTRDFLATG